MKSFLKTIPVSFVFPVVCQGAPAVTTNATYTEVAEASIEVEYRGNIVYTESGKNDAQPESVSVNVSELNTDYPGTYSAKTFVTTSETGPRAQSTSLLGTMRTSSDVGYYRADTDGFANIYYNLNVTNKGLEFNNFLYIPLEVKAKGEAAAAQTNLGEAYSGAGIQIVRISDTGHESVLLDQWADASALPTNDCKYRLSDCSTRQMTKKLDLEATFALVLEAGKPVPNVQVNVAANTRIKSDTAYLLTSAYPPAYEFWGGEGIAYAWMDPVINIDPTWEYADWFDLEFSPGVVQAVVPIPAAAWLFGSGLLGMALTARRRNTDQYLHS